MDGSDQRQLAEQRADLGIDALDWSPDGRKIAVASAGRGIFVVDVDGAGSTRLSNGRDESPRWSPNGRRILFERYLFEPNNSGADIFVMNADGSRQQRLTHGSGHESPSWAPGGRRIAFQSWSDVTGRKDSLGNWELYVMNANGSDQRPVTRTPRSDDQFPSWSPGGRKILFLSRTSRRSYAVHVINPDGTGRRNLTRGSTANHEPEWSPEGRSIVFASAREGNWNIFVMTATGLSPTNLTKSPKGTQNTVPAWSP
jgi:Tol biopolymer transport system component